MKELTYGQNKAEMKKIIIIISLFFVFGSTTAQTGVTDTLAYLQTIVANKANYVGQPFYVLSNTLQIQIKYFSPFGGDHSKRNKEASTGFAFYFPINVNDLYLSYPRLSVKWKVPLNAEISREIRDSNEHGKWLPNAVTFYNNAIISDIYILE